jgi:exopolyphosphatase / guanosine-5'-triphosphate,3'-diphosphate pyrophosphatase
MQSAAKHMREMLAPVTEEIQAWVNAQQPVVMTSGGTATTYAAVLLKQPVYDRIQVNNVNSDPRQLAETLTRLSRLPLAQRQRVPGMEKDRAEVLPAGLMIFAAICEQFHLQQFRITGNGLRTGLLRHYLETRLVS